MMMQERNYVWVRAEMSLLASNQCSVFCVCWQTVSFADSLMADVLTSLAKVSDSIHVNGCKEARVFGHTFLLSGL
jgi:hypothetical protein